MPASEEERLALLNRLTETLGADAARTLMESLPPTHWDQIATKDDLRALEERLVQKFMSEVNKVKSGLAELSGRVEGEFGRIDGKFANLRGELSEVRGEVREVRGEVREVRGEISEVRGEVRELRGDIKELHGSISLEISKQTRTLVFMLCGFALTVWISLFAIGAS